MRKVAVLLCLVSIFFVLFTGCNKPVTPSSSSSQESSGSESSSSAAPEPETPSAPIPGETKDFAVVTGGTEETVTMTCTSLDFSHWAGAPEVYLYIDSSRYDCYLFEGEYNIAPLGSDMETTCVLHIYPAVGTSAQQALEDIKESIVTYDWGSITQEGTADLYNHSALFAATDRGQSYYFVDYEGGCLLVSLSVAPEAAQQHGPLMEEILKTLYVM